MQLTHIRVVIASGMTIGLYLLIPCDQKRFHMVRLFFNIKKWRLVAPMLMFVIVMAFPREPPVARFRATQSSAAIAFLERMKSLNEINLGPRQLVFYLFDSVLFIKMNLLVIWASSWLNRLERCFRACASLQHHGFNTWIICLLSPSYRTILPTEKKRKRKEKKRKKKKRSISNLLMTSQLQDQ